MTLSEEIKSDLLGAYQQICEQCRQKDHELRNEQNKTRLLLDLLAQLRDTPAAVLDRVDRVLGRIAE
jgi:hypothetical protein